MRFTNRFYKSAGIVGVSVFFIALVTSSIFAFSGSNEASRIPPEWLLETMQAVALREKELGVESVLGAKIETGKGAAAFTSERAFTNESQGIADINGATDPSLPNALNPVLDDVLKVRTIFDTTSNTIRKKVLVQRGSFQSEFSTTLQNKGKSFAQNVYATSSGDVYTYKRAGETFIYSQVVGDNSVSLKEWIQVDQAPSESRLEYVWDFESADESRAISLEKNADNSASLYQEIVIVGVDQKDTNKQQHVMDVVNDLFKNKLSVQGREEIARLSPPIYWTVTGEKRQGEWKVVNNTLVLSIAEANDAYPLLIDPSLSWGQWTGGGLDSGSEEVRAIIVDNEEIFIGGYISGEVAGGIIAFQGSYSGATEGFVAKITDGVTPTLNWGQWLGGTGDEGVNALAVNGDEIYAGGQSNSVNLWETVTFQGSHSGNAEGFVVEIADGVTPTLNWGQWLGGTSYEYLQALAVTGDEIYAGGYSNGATSWETVTFQGTYSGSQEGFVVKITDGATPALSWGQWFGGTGDDQVKALIIDGGEIYVGGHSSNASSWETVTFQGVISGYEGFVIEMADGGVPTLIWGQWLGGTGGEAVTTLAVNGDEIYAGGYSDSGISWETVTFQGSHSGSNEGFVVEIADGVTPTLNWGQWLGGTGVDYLNALVVSGDEIYAGGTSYGLTSWETVAFQGSFGGSIEGFVIEIADGVTPTLNWGQWLGGTGGEGVNSLAINGDNIYVGGNSSSDAASWEAVTFQGLVNSNYRGFAIEIADGVTPTLNWGQWVSYGGGSVIVRAIAVEGDEIYIGGESGDSGAWSEAVTFQGAYSGTKEGFVVEIADGVTPTLNWGQWLGGTGTDSVNALAVNGDEIYAGGYSTVDTTWEAVTFQGTYSGGGNEGFVVEIADGATPTLNWGQWLGGDQSDLVYALAVNIDEIYAGGVSGGSVSWEPVTFQGTLNNQEGFVVEIADGATPTLNWGQWLGGTGGEYVYALAINGDEIYAAGYTTSAAFSGETITFQGTVSSFEGFVVEIVDGATPTLSWGQWLGGTGMDYAYAVAVSGDEIYVGGTTPSTSSWEAVTFQGTYSGGNEGFVVEIADGVTPTLNWGQWLGGTGGDVVNALTVNGDEIYVGGYSSSNTSWETAIAAFKGSYSGSNEGFVVEIFDGATPAINWGQWIGGSGLDFVYALGVVDNEIYAGGYSSSLTTSLLGEAVTMQGVKNLGDEGFTVEIFDGTFFSSVAPLSSTTINRITASSEIAFTVSDTLTAGSITITRTSGTDDANSPHVCTLQGTALNTGAHAINLSDTTNGCASDVSDLVSGTVYTFVFAGTDIYTETVLPITKTEVTYIDNVPPSAPGVPDLTAATDSGQSATDNITSDITPDLTISCETLATVTLYDNTTAIGTGTCVASTVTITSSALSEGIHATINAKQADVVGNVSVASGNLTLRIDSSIIPPGIPDMTAGTDTGIDNDNKTSDTTPTFAISCETDATVLLYDDVTLIGGGACLSSSVIITAYVLSEGVHTLIHSQQTDVAGNLSDVSENIEVTIDTGSPTGTVIINGGITYTNIAEATLSLSAVDSLTPVLEMMISDNEEYTGAVWEAYATSKGITFTDDGTKTVFVQFKDTVGNIGATTSSTILYDTAGPQLLLLSSTKNISSVLYSGTAYDRILNIYLQTNITPAVFTGSNQNMSWNTDDGSWKYTFQNGFKLPLYGSLYSDMYVSSNGRICFSSGSSLKTGSLADTTCGAFIAPFWTDLGTAGNTDKISITQNADNVSVEWKDSTLNSIPATGLIGGGVAQNWQADDSAWNYTLPFSFPFYGTDYTLIKVGSNGHICFSQIESCRWYADPISRSGYPPGIIPLGQDLRTDGSGQSGEDIYITEASNQVIIRWQAETYDGNYPVNVELVLKSDGSIQFNYGQNPVLNYYAIVGVAKGDGVSYTASPTNETTDFSTAVNRYFSYSGGAYTDHEVQPINDTILFDVEAVLYNDGRIQFNYNEGYDFSEIGSITAPIVGVSKGDGSTYTASSLSGSNFLTTEAKSLLFRESPSINLASITYSVDADPTLTNCTPEDGTIDGSLENFSCQTSLADGEHTFTINATDALGNSGSVQTETILIDSSLPTGSVVINEGSLYTAVANITLHLSATDATTSVPSMMISNDATFAGASWETYATSKAYTLSANGTQTFYVKFKDELDNESAIYSASVTLDTVKPTIRITDLGLIDNIPDKSPLFYYFTSQTPHIKGTAEAHSTVHFVYDGNDYTATANSSGNYEIDIPELPRQYVELRYYAIDRAGNRSATRKLQLTIGIENFPAELVAPEVNELEVSAPTTSPITSPTTSGEDSPMTIKVFEILVVDANEMPLVLTTVYIEGQRYTTDENGKIYLEKIPTVEMSISVEIAGRILKGSVMGEKIIAVKAKEGIFTNGISVGITLFLVLLIFGGIGYGIVRNRGHVRR